MSVESSLAPSGYHLPPSPGCYEGSDAEESCDEMLGRAYRKHRACLVDWAAICSRDPDTAEDIVQDVFVRVSRLWRSRRDETVLATAYLRRAVRNEALNRRKLDAREKTRRQAAARRAHRPPTPEDQVIGEDTTRRLRAVVHDLPASARRAFVAVDLRGERTIDVALTWGVSQKAVEMRLASARRRLRRALDEWT